MKRVWWDSADLNRGPSVPNARGWTKLPYYPAEYLLSKGIILYISFVRKRVCSLRFFVLSRTYVYLYLPNLSHILLLFLSGLLFPSFFPVFFSHLFFQFSIIPNGDRCRFLPLTGQGPFRSLCPQDLRWFSAWNKSPGRQGGYLPQPFWL